MFKNLVKEEVREIAFRYLMKNQGMLSMAEHLILEFWNSGTATRHLLVCGHFLVKSNQTQLSVSGQQTMASRRSGTGRHSEPGGSKHPGLAQRTGDPLSIPSFQALSSKQYIPNLSMKFQRILVQI